MSPQDDILRQAFAAAVGKRITDPFLAEDLRKVVDMWFATTDGQSFRRGFVSAEEMWAALDPAAKPYYGRPISEVPIREIYNASPAALNVGTATDAIFQAVGGLVARGGLLVGLIALLLMGVWITLQGTPARGAVRAFRLRGVPKVRLA